MPSRKPDPRYRGTFSSSRDSTFRRTSIRRTPRVESLDPRRVLAAAIVGTVFDDANASLVRDEGEAALVGRLVFLDLNENGTFDSDEPRALTDDEGGFGFEGLDPGTYAVRMFVGESQQVVTTAPLAVGVGEPVELEWGRQVVVADGRSIVRTDVGLVVTDFVEQPQTINIADQVDHAALLPANRMLVAGRDADGDQAWLVDLDDASILPVDIPDMDGVGATPPTGDAGVRDMAVDGTGLGVAVVGDSTETQLVAIDGRAALTTSNTGIVVPADTSVLTSSTGSRSVLAWSGNGGLEVSLYSNATASLITSTPTDIPGGEALVAFDDAAGILVVRNDGGGVSVHDVDAGFALLHTIENFAGPVSVDGSRDLIGAFDSATSTLRLLAATDGQSLAEIPIDTAAMGTITAMAATAAGSLTLVGESAVAGVAFENGSTPAVVAADGSSPSPLVIGVHTDDANTPPQYANVPTFVTDEDTTLSESAPATLAGAFDVDGDDITVLQLTAAEHGIATLTPDGGIEYVPELNFNGTDSVDLVLHDGFGPSDPATILITVHPIDDPLIGINITTNSVPESAEIGFPVLDFEVIGGDHPIIVVDDDRFGVQGNQVVLLGGPLDFETESGIPLTITTSDDGDDPIEEEVTLTITDANDPITGITPTTAFVFENSPGDLITELKVQDQDFEQFHELTVDDERFVIDQFDLRLAPGVALDYELESEVVVNVTATEVGGPNRFTQAITVTVRDQFEQPSGMTLFDGEVTELITGDTAGEILIDNATVSGRFELTVDDDRFEVVEGGVLKLRDGVFVDRDVQSEIIVVVTAVDLQNQFATIEESFSIVVLVNERIGHNVNNPVDTNDDGAIAPADALNVILHISEHGAGPIDRPQLIGEPGIYPDVNGDGKVTPLDALLVINSIEDGGPTVGGEPEGESITTETIKPDSIEPETIEPDTSPADRIAGRRDHHGRWARPTDDDKSTDAALAQWLRDLDRLF